MNKNFLYIAVGAVILLTAVYFATQSGQPQPVEEQTQQEAVEEVKQTETPQEAGQTTIEKIDQEFSASGEADFNADGLSNEELGL